MKKTEDLKHYVMLKETNISRFNKKSNELIERGFLPFQEPIYKINEYDDQFFLQCFISEETFKKIENIKNLKNNNNF